MGDTATETKKKGTSDLEIARAHKLRHIQEIAEAAGVHEDELELYGKYKAKVDLGILERLKDRPNGKYIVVTAITPTPLGEGKTVNTIGLSQAIGKLGKKVFTCIRQPSLGPVFGIKGGAAGGGHSQVVPMEEFNLHLTGDMHAVSAANNLLAAWIDSSILLKNKFNIDPDSVTWKRVVDINDRALREITIGQGGSQNGIERKTGFMISSASEVMACLALAENLVDLRERLGRITIGTDRDGNPVTAEQMGAAGAMAVLMKDAVKPTLMQTLEYTPCFVHAGPFANIAHGNSSIVADRIALKLSDYVVTESGFGADMGAEKFFNIKCRVSGLKPDAAALVATVRALKMHGSDHKIRPGKPLPDELVEENLDLLEKGCGNLVKQIENVKKHGVPVVVCVNRFTYDSEAEVERVRQIALEAGADAAEVSDVWADGGNGGRKCAEALIEAASKPNEFHHLYPSETKLAIKIETVARELYGADGVDFEPGVIEKLERLEKWGKGDLPVCMAKTQLSLSHDGSLRGRPTGFRVPVRDVRLSAGAGFVTALLGKMRTMPGMGSKPALMHIDLDENGEIEGLS